MSRLVVGVLTLIVGGCLDNPTTWTAIYESSIAPSCTTSACHSQLSRAGGLDFHDRDTAFQTLTGRSCAADASKASGFVDVDEPSASYLLEVLARRGARGMPPNRMLSRTERDYIAVWIGNGALCD